MQALPVQTHLLEGLGTVVGDEDVSIGEQLVHDLEALFGLEVQRDEALVHVGHVEAEVFVVRGRHAENSSLVHAARVALCGLDLDDVGAPFAEHATSRRRGKKRGQVNDFDALQW